tara:strand:- start:2483 stop:2722 length:240 start_codon:yes stop_codon:yes gene_type:complete
MRKPRVEKSEYFKMRYQNAIDNNLSDKAEYYKSRLVQMGKWMDVKTSSDSKGMVTRHELSFGGSEAMVFYSAKGTSPVK